MKEIQLTQGKIALVDDQDFDKVKDFNYHADRRSSDGRWYAKRYIRKEEEGYRYIHQSMHRDIFGLGCGDPEEVDHIALGSESGLDNRRSNLRLADQNQNRQNVGLQKNSTSGLKGVRLVRATKENRRLTDVWRAGIQVAKKRIHLGYFSSPELAAQRYDDFAWLWHGDFAVTNASLGLLPVKKPVQSVTTAMPVAA